MYRQTDSPTTDDMDILDHYHNEGWKLVPADPETKGGVGKHWQKRDVSLAFIRRHIERGGGVGAQVGEVSNWLAVADADHEYAIITAPAFLPDTLLQAKGDEISHYVMYCEGLGYQQFNDLSGKRLIDIKASNNGAGHLVVLEPTHHPRKGSYRFVGGFNPAAIAHVPLRELQRRIRLWACSTLIAVHLPQTREEGEGGRHHISLAIAGFGLRNGWTEEETLKVLTEAWKARKAPEKALQAIERNVADTARKITNDEPATGGRTLEELMPGLPGKIAKFMGWQRADRREGQSHNLTDMGNAERFIDQHGHRVRYCYEWASWLVWDGVHWGRDVGGGRVRKLAKGTVRSIYHEAAETPDDDLRKAIAKHAASSEATTRIDAMLKQAECEVPITPAELDSDPYLLNCLNGTIDLRTGEMLDHNQAHYLTKLAPVEYGPNAKAPTFEAFLGQVQPKEDVRGFLKRAVGYSATADTSEQCMFIDHGSGMNGKSTFAEAIAAALGDYAQRAPTEMLMVRRSGGIPNDVARLKGARFVTASETEEGRRLAESLVKDLTGSDTITARFMRAEFFDFVPTHKLWLSTNHKPEIRGTDLAIWRRIRLVPWSVKIPPPEQDKKLPEKIRAELPGVLAWIVEGCLEWQEQGLNPPEDVRAATQAYRAESDVLAGFLADCCKIGETETEYATALWKAWQRWAEQSGETVGTQNRFGGKLRERGFLNLRDSKTGRKMWRGLSLWPDWENRAGIPLNLSTLRFAGNSESSEPSEPKNDISSSKNAREAFMCKKGSGGSGGSGGTSNRRLTQEETIEVQKLILEGMDAKLARAAVLREDLEGELGF